MNEATIPVVASDASRFDRDVLEPRGELVVVYFWGDECPNCEFFAAELPALLRELGPVRARLVKVNAYQETDLARRFGLFGIPAFFLFRDGTKLGKMSEFRGRRFFLDTLRDHLPT